MTRRYCYTVTSAPDVIGNYYADPEPEMRYDLDDLMLPSHLSWEQICTKHNETATAHIYNMTLTKYLLKTGKYLNLYLATGISEYECVATVNKDHLARCANTDFRIPLFGQLDKKIKIDDVSRTVNLIGYDLKDKKDKRKFELLRETLVKCGLGDWEVYVNGKLHTV